MKKAITMFLFPILFMANIALSADLTNYSLDQHSYQMGGCTVYFETAPVSPYEQGFCTVKCGKVYSDFYFAYEHPIVLIFDREYTWIDTPLEFVVSNDDYKLYYLASPRLELEGNATTQIDD